MFNLPQNFQHYFKGKYMLYGVADIKADGAGVWNIVGYTLMYL